jgi:hypothetical protein
MCTGREQDEVEPELDDTHLLVCQQHAEEFCSIVHVVFIPNSGQSVSR